MRTAVALGIMVLVGLPALGTPFRGDQALFTQYAARMETDILYRDLWDVTNPGVYWFYQIAGTLFGFTENGIHFGEWLWFTAFVLILGRFSGAPVATALLVGGWYYATSCTDPSHLTKAEGLVAFPMFLSVAAASRNRWALAGLAGGIVVLFKFAFALCLLMAWWPYSWKLITVVIPPALATVYFAAHDALGIAFETLFVAPREILAHAEPAPFERLAQSIRWFLETSVPLAVLATAGSLLHCDRFVRALLRMLPAAGIVILSQRWSWWSYHFELLSLPLAVLAAYLWPILQRELFQLRSAYLVLFVLFLVPIAEWCYALTRLSERPVFARLHSGHAYAVAEDDTATLGDGTLWVAGDPLFYQFAERPQAIRTHGWALELFTPRLWQQLETELKATPPTWVFIDRREHHYEARLPQSLLEWLRANYEPKPATSGTWWRKR